MDSSALRFDKAVYVRAQYVQWYRFLSLDLPREHLHLEAVTHPSPAARICNEIKVSLNRHTASHRSQRPEIFISRYARCEYLAPSDPFRSPFSPICVDLD